MEKFYKVEKGSDFYNHYFDFEKSCCDITKAFRDFKKFHPMEASEFYVSTNQLAVCLTDNDIKKYKEYLKKNSHEVFKKTSRISKEWVELCRERNLCALRKPSIIWDGGIGLSFHRYSERLFNIGEELYGSINNKMDCDFELKEPFIEILGSEFYKAIEDAEKGE